MLLARARHLAVIGLSEGDNSLGGWVVVDQQISCDQERFTAALDLNWKASRRSHIGHHNDIILDGKLIDIYAKDRATQKNIVAELATKQRMGAAVAGQGHGLRLVCVVDDTPLNHDVTRFS